MVPVGPALFAVKPPEAETWSRSPSTSCRPVRRTCTSASAPRRGCRPMTDLDMLADVRDPGRVRVAVGRPGRGGPLGRGRRAGRRRPSRGRTRADRARRPHPPALAVRRRAVPGAPARPPRHGVAARHAGDHPFAVEDGVLRGPGCFDMKAGLVMAFHAWPRSACDGVTLLVTGDEELGSPSSRGLIEEEADGPRAALVLEASADGGALKTERKGVSLYEVRVAGRAAHAGLEPEKGVNATVELAHQVLAVARSPTRRPARRSRRPSAGPAPRPTPCPAAGSFAVDVRAAPLAEQERVDRRCARSCRCCPARASRCRRAEPAAARGRRVGGAVRAGLRDRRTPGPARARPAQRSAARPTATSPPASACPRWTASARSAAERTRTTSTSWSTSCPAHGAAARPGRGLLAGAIDEPARAAGAPTMTTRADQEHGTRDRPQRVPR